MIENLKLTAPHILDLIKDQLIGGGGIPDENGNAHPDSLVWEAEKQYNAKHGTYWYRFFRPNDPFVGGTEKVYYATFTTVTEEELLALGSAITVKTREMIAIFGWICDIDLGRAGYLQIKKHGTVKQELHPRIVWRQQKPDNMYIDLDTVIYGVENEVFNFIVYNGYGADRSGIVIPIMFRIASRSALNLDKNLDI